MKNDKKITSENDEAIFYDDGSVDVVCSNCGKMDELGANSPQAVRLNQIAGSERDYLCLNCWKEKQDEAKQARDEERLKDIHSGQALNLAVNTVVALFRDEIKDDPKKIRELVKPYFESYKKLIEELND